MKKPTLILTLLLSFVFNSNIIAQKNVHKDVLLAALNSVVKLKLSNYKTSELIEYNKAYADKIYNILESPSSNGNKKSALKTLQSDSEKDLMDMLGKKSYKKYNKLLEDNLDPLVKKEKLLKNLY